MKESGLVVEWPSDQAKDSGHLTAGPVDRLSTSLFRALLVLGLALGLPVAAELNFSADVDRTTVGLGEQLQLTVTVSGTNIGGVPRPQLGELPDFTNLGSTSSQSTNISFVNGRMTQEQTISFIYFLSPKRVGNLTIGPATLDFKGATYQTQPIAITVTRESQAPPPRQQAPPDPFDWDPFGRRQQQPARPVRGAVHLAAYADRTGVYQGEQVTVSFTFYTQRQVASLNMADVPAFTGFWSENLFEAKELEYRDRDYQGQRYSAATIRRVALFPTRSGELEVGAMKLAGQALSSGGFFFQSAEPFEVSSDPIKVSVKPLPEQGRPASFSGGVGDFTVKAALSADSSVDGAPVNAVFTVSGTGNVRLVGEPKLAGLSGLKVLSPEAKDNIRTGDGRVAGTREFTFPLIPTADGKHVVPAVEFGFFDPEAGAYYTRTTEPLEFYAAGAGSAAAASTNDQGVKVLGSDIRYIKSAFAPAAGSGRAGVAWWHGLFGVAGVAVFVAGALLGRHRRRIEQDTGYARRARSSGLVKKRLALARKLLAAGNERDFYSALAQAITGYAGDRFNIEAGGMTGDELSSELGRRGVEPAAVGELLELIKGCDAARFSPGMVSCSAGEMLERTRKLMERL